MRRDKIEALKLRRSGKSYNEIHRLLGVPKSTLSNWCAGVVLSDSAQSRIVARVQAGVLAGLVKRNKQQTHLAKQRAQTFHTIGRSEISRITLNELRLIGLALYWAEGYKRPVIVRGRERTQHPVSFSNSDPKLVAFFLRFLREISKVPDKKIKAEIRMYQHMNSATTIAYWKKITRLPIDNFTKLYYGVSKSSQGKRPFNRLPHGTIQIRVNDTQLFHKIMGGIEGLALQTSKK